MTTCGNCKAQGQTVEHVRNCYAAKRTVKPVLAVMEAPAEVTGFAASWVAKALGTEGPFSVPDSKYALPTKDGSLAFYEVQTSKKAKWEGWQFVSLLIGSPGDWRKVAIKGPNRLSIIARIAQDPREAAVRYSKEFTICAVCSAPLSDEESRARGLGPTCAKRF